VLVGPGPGVSQEVDRLRLAPSNGTVLPKFTQVRSVRELSDGRILIADGAEERLLVYDFKSEHDETIGRVGGGPGEYRGVGPLFPLSQDSTLFLDSYSARWNLLDRDRIVETKSELRPVNRLLGGSLAGVDGFGHALGVQGDRSSGGARSSRHTADTLLLLLVDRQAESADTISKLKGPGRAGLVNIPPGPDRPIAQLTNNPLASEDQAILFLDGWIAVARVDPYRVDWRTPEGQWLPGPALPVNGSPLEDEEKCFAIERALPSMGTCDPGIFPAWPSQVPPFLPNRPSKPSILGSPDGHVLIARTPTLAAPGVRYDEVDRKGVLVREIRLDPKRVIVGFGAATVYTLLTDTWDLQSLHKHPWGSERPDGS
jgi:hypothetical protein